MAIREKNPDIRPKKNLTHRIILALLMIATLGVIIIAISLFNYVLKPNVITGNNKPVSLFIPTGSGFSDVKNILYEKGLILNRRSFEWVAGRKNYA
jgi:cell division protein YceG involved in septum cleavage